MPRFGKYKDLNINTFYLGIHYAAQYKFHTHYFYISVFAIGVKPETSLVENFAALCLGITQQKKINTVYKLYIKMV